ncbi:unnamed protein product [Rotaria sp. Silwood1]|nr:unnamed protein product [Rotaria sp. Silwood1]CAF1601414.1 unnamed protein product [Rotaria sp. Silwood1]CAF3754181.1 unnamed protein product [Rotaria sp. Silwood1]CAF3823853.1 unnamed protein product [Rotaria sp. Silwood1]
MSSYFFDVSISQDSIQQFLLRMPSLRHLELIVNYNGHHSLCDGYHWEIFIRNQLTMLTKFDFHFKLAWYQTHDWVNDDVILAPFLTSFWIGQERQWFVVYNRQSRSLFTVPRFTPTICSHRSASILPHTTTVPREKYDIFYDHITELILDNIFFMDSLSKGCIGKLLRGEELVLPVVLLLEETSLLYVNADVCDERDVASVRLRLSDSTDSFYGMTAMILYVCA